MNKRVIFLKLGGSLITDKKRENSVRTALIQRLAEEIQAARTEKTDFDLLLGHGSGSFGHFAAKKYGTRSGVRSPEEWMGFAEVWTAARELHQIVVNQLNLAGLPVIGIAPSSAATTRKASVSKWDLAPVHSAIDNGLIPLLYGDVVFDEQIGGSILSTEEIFLYLTREISPDKILLAANEPVFSDFPQKEQILPEINPQNFGEIRATLSGGEGKDVTGGMLSKVEATLKMLANAQESAEAWIFSGEEPGQIKQAILDKPTGTRLSSQPG